MSGAGKSRIRPFASPEKYMRNADAIISNRLVASSSDISLVVDRDGIICDVGFGSDREVIENAREWVGKPWMDTVTVESRGKIEDLLKTEEETAPSAWRQVNHPTESGPDTPVMYRALARDADDYLVVAGRDIGG